MKEVTAIQRAMIEFMTIVISDGFSALEQYTSHTTDLLDNWHIERLKKLESNYLNDERDTGEFLNQQVDLRVRRQMILFNSIFISCVSQFEYQFKSICLILDPKQEELNKIREELKKNGEDSNIRAYRRFVMQILKIDLSAKKDLWLSLYDHCEVRNKLVHDGGTLSPTSGLIKKIEEMKHIRLDRPIEDYIEIQIIDCKFIYDYITTASDYLYYVVGEIEKVLPPPKVNTPITFVRHTDSPN